MDTFLGLLGVAVFIPAVVAIACAVTWLVVKISPAPNPAKSEQQRSD
jgi:hypothetical protein